MMKRLLLAGLLLVFCSALCLADGGVKINFTRPANLPYFIGLPEFNLDSDDYDTVRIQIRSSQSGPARLFWASSYDPQLNDQKSLTFYLSGSNHYQTYYFNVRSQNPNWLGFVPQFLLLPENGPAGVEIGSAAALQGNLFTNLLSGWQEFGGPRGRVEIGSSINITPSSAVFGRSINIYLYWIIGLFFFLFWGIKRSFPEAAKNALIVALGCWIFLALNSDLNYFGLFKTNLNKYFGKTLEQKHAIAYGQDYYDFLIFAKEKLPQTPVMFGLLSSKYAPELAARIYLVPHILVDAKQRSPEYILVFQPSPAQQEEARKHPLAAKLNEGAYIIKR